MTNCNLQRETYNLRNINGTNDGPWEAIVTTCNTHGLIRRYEDERLPFSLELNPDGSEIPNGAGVRHRLQPNVTEVGSERPIPIHPSSPSKSTSVPAAAVATVCHTRSPTHAPESTHNYETTFDLDGNVETASLTSSRDGNR